MLNVISIKLPPLRERVNDIPLIIDYFVDKFSHLLKKEIRGLSQEVLDILLKYPWPGNVRELENAIEYAINFCPNGAVITESHLPEWLRNPEILSTKDSLFKNRIRKTEKQFLTDLLQTYGNSLEAKEKVAEDMGISLSTLLPEIKEI